MSVVVMMEEGPITVSVRIFPGDGAVTVPAGYKVVTS